MKRINLLGNFRSLQFQRSFITTDCGGFINKNQKIAIPKKFDNSFCKKSYILTNNDNFSTGIYITGISNKYDRTIINKTISKIKINRDYSTSQLTPKKNKNEFFDSIKTFTMEFFD